MSYANVAATLALVFSMTGGAMAARRYLINSTRQINPKVLRALRGANGRNGATGARGPTGAGGAKGDRGAAGERGAAGANGATRVVVRFAQAETLSGATGRAQASCQNGERATGGGTELALGDITRTFFLDTGGRPAPETQGATPTGWSNEWTNQSGVTETIRVYVICSSP